LTCVGLVPLAVGHVSEKASEHFAVKVQQGVSFSL